MRHLLVVAALLLLAVVYAGADKLDDVEAQVAAAVTRAKRRRARGGVKKPRVRSRKANGKKTSSKRAGKKTSSKRAGKKRSSSSKRAGKKASSSKKKKCHYAKQDAFNPKLDNNERSDKSDSCVSRVVGGRRVCAERPSVMLKVGNLATDVWISDKPIWGFHIRAGAAATRYQGTVMRQPGAHVYFNPSPVRRIMADGVWQDVAFTWTRKGAPGWLPLALLPTNYRNAVVRAMRPSVCARAAQRNHGCIRRPRYRGPHRTRCTFRASNAPSVTRALEYGFVFPQPRLPKGQKADAENVLGHYLLRPMSIYNIAANLPARDGAAVAFDVAHVGEPFFLHPSRKARRDVGVFYAGDQCERHTLPWVYGAPARADDANKPDWDRAGWVPRVTLDC